MASGNRPLWVIRIKRRIRLNVFKYNARWLLENNHDITRALRGKSEDFVYEVTVETMENVDTNCYEDIWISEDLANATGMIENFLDENDEDSDEDDDIEEDVPIEIERQYQMMCQEEQFAFYDSVNEDDFDL